MTVTINYLHGQIKKNNFETTPNRFSKRQKKGACEEIFGYRSKKELWEPLKIRFLNLISA